VTFSTSHSAHHPPCLPEVLPDGCDVEGPPSSECAAVIGCDHDQEYVCDGIGVDEEREHQQVCGGECRCESAETCVFSFKILIRFSLMIA